MRPAPGAVAGRWAGHDWGLVDPPGLRRDGAGLDPGLRRDDAAAKASTLGALAPLRHFRILATTPAPTVRPPSRIAKRRPSSIATGLISSTTIFTLSPGITISVPSGSVTAPVMSVVRK